MGAVDAAFRNIAALINSPFEYLYRLMQYILGYIVCYADATHNETSS